MSSVSVELRGGEVHAIVGENGAGKSSLAKAIAGVYASSGSYSLDGVDISFRNPREALHAGVALIHQEPSSFPDLDVAENIFAGHLPRRGVLVDHRAMHARAAELLQSLGVSIDPRARMRGLSVAARQYVELAAALAHDARVWIFDETTAPLTPNETRELFAVIRRLKEEGCAIAFVSHHLHEVLSIADRITVLRDGSKVGERLVTETNETEIVRLMVGRDLEAFVPRSGAVGEVALGVQGLIGPGFGPVDLDVRSGEIVGIAGLVGAGRTEFFRSLFGVTRATSGEIKLHANRVQIRRPADARRMGIALVPEDRIHDGLLLPKGVAFNTVLPNLDKSSTLGWVGGSREESLTRDQVERLHLRYRGLHQPGSELSGGNQQKVVLAKWLMSSPSVLLLDEPTRGVDIGAKAEVHKVVRALADDGMAVLVASSDLPELLALCDRIAVMRNGRIVASFAQAEATEEAIMSAATGGASG